MSKGISMPIQISTRALMGAGAAVFFLAVVLPLLLSTQGMGLCGGSGKFIAARIADMTGSTICQ